MLFSAVTQPIHSQVITWIVQAELSLLTSSAEMSLSHHPVWSQLSVIQSYSVTASPSQGLDSPPLTALRS